MEQRRRVDGHKRFLLESGRLPFSPILPQRLLHGSVAQSSVRRKDQSARLHHLGHQRSPWMHRRCSSSLSYPRNGRPKRSCGIQFPHFRSPDDAHDARKTGSGRMGSPPFQHLFRFDPIN